VEKIASAAKISLAKQSLVEDHNRLLYRINNEAKVRRSTRSLVIGTAKVMEWEDLDKARIARAAKDKAAADKGKGKRGPKREITAREAEDNVEGDVDSQELGLSVPASKGKRAKRSNVRESEPWRAPVAPMYNGAP
jgi:hypothetical protein